MNWVAFDTYYHQVLPDLGAHFHFRNHMQPSIAKLRAALGYDPQFTPEQTLARARREGPELHARWRQLFDKTFI